MLQCSLETGGLNLMSQFAISAIVSARDAQIIQYRVVNHALMGII
jgi:hypothetical protein